MKMDRADKRVMDAATVATAKNSHYRASGKAGEIGTYLALLAILLALVSGGWT